MYYNFLFIMFHCNIVQFLSLVIWKLRAGINFMESYVLYATTIYDFYLYVDSYKQKWKSYFKFVCCCHLIWNFDMYGISAYIIMQYNCFIHTNSESEALHTYIIRCITKCHYFVWSPFPLAQSHKAIICHGDFIQNIMSLGWIHRKECFRIF